MSDSVSRCCSSCFSDAFSTNGVGGWGELDYATAPLVSRTRAPSGCFACSVKRAEDCGTVFSFRFDRLLWSCFFFSVPINLKEGFDRTDFEDGDTSDIWTVKCSINSDTVVVCKHTSSQRHRSVMSCPNRMLRCPLPAIVCVPPLWLSVCVSVFHLCLIALASLVYLACVLPLLCATSSLSLYKRSSLRVVPCGVFSWFLNFYLTFYSSVFLLAPFWILVARLRLPACVSTIERCSRFYSVFLSRPF